MRLGRSESRPKGDDVGARRSSSMDSTKWRRALGQLTPKPSNTGNVKPMTKTVDNGTSKVILSKSEADSRRRPELAKSSQPARNNSSGNSFARRMNGVKLGLTGDQILPSYTRRRTDQTAADRSFSVDASPTETSPTTKAVLHSEEEVATRSVQPTVPPPDLLRAEYCAEDEELNAKMELLYEQYRDIELGTNRTVDVTSAGESSADPRAVKKPSTATEPKRRGDGPTVRRQHSEKSPLRAELGDKSNVRRTISSTVSKASKPLNRPKSSPPTRGSVSRKDSEDFTPLDQIVGRSEGFRFGTKGKVNQLFPGRTSSDVTDNAVRPSGPARMTAAGKNRTLSRSRESVLDGGGGTLRRTTAHGGLCRSLTDISDKRLVLRTTPIHTVTEDAHEDFVDLTKAKPRKDDRLGPPTRIPHPVGDQKQRRLCCDQSSLKRFDSGVDITNVSPNGENGNYSIDEEDASMYRQWTVNAQCTEACSLSDQKLAYSAPPPLIEDEYY